MAQLRAVRFDDAFQQTSFESLLGPRDFLSDQIDHLAQQLKTLTESYSYRERNEILTSIPCLGWLSAVEILLELQDTARFQRADQLAASVGLTLGQHSSGEHVRTGNSTVRRIVLFRYLSPQKERSPRKAFSPLRGLF